MIEHKKWMQMALKEAKIALTEDEIPVGAIVIFENQIIGKGYNQREKLNDPTAHAEMIAITAAANFLDSWRLDDCTLFVTLEPCPMCAGAIVNARIPEVVFGVQDKQYGACVSQFMLCDHPSLNHSVKIVPNIMEEECKAVLGEFFSNLRTEK